MSSQVANGYPNQMGTMMNGQGMNAPGHHLPPAYGAPNGMPMGMNGHPGAYQQPMGVMNQPGGRPMGAWQQNGMVVGGNSGEFHPMYNGQAGMNNPMMYGQPPNLNAQPTQTPPPTAGAAGKKVAQKRKSAQQNGANDAGGRALKQAPFMPQMPPNGMPGQHFQQFPQSAQMFNGQGGQHMSGPMNSAQFNASNPAAMNHMNSYPNGMPNGGPNNFNQHAQWAAANQQKRPSSESIRQELRTTVRARQNASSPSGSNVPSTAASNEMGGPRFPPNVATATPPSNLTSPQRMNGMQQPGALQQPPMYSRTMPLQQQQHPMNGGMFAPQHPGQPNGQTSSPATSKPPMLLHLEEIHDWKIGNGRFDMDNEETKLLVQQLLM
ncbi:hypothetical protein M3Y99_00061200 [Aphelenchoides fujianensis]|nr:hypothetical protein M3Y99_00061200 [Aphelenchoides fujianensis]